MKFADSPKFVVGIQARATSTRLPGKNFYKLGDVKLCEWSIQQAKLYFPRAPIFLLIPDDDFANLFKDIASENCVNVILGHATDVLSRYEALANKYPEATIARWTADNPIKCSTAMDFLLSSYLQTPDKYVAWQNLRKTAVELVPALLIGNIRNGDYFTEHCAEHVTYGLRNKSIGTRVLLRDCDLKLPRAIDQQLTIDTASEFRFIENLVNSKALKPNQKIDLSSIF